VTAFSYVIPVLFAFDAVVTAYQTRRWLAGYRPPGQADFLIASWAALVMGALGAAIIYRATATWWLATIALILCWLGVHHTAGTAKPRRPGDDA
jgi:1,4-dihydroxy-2-naphthoate octaprenyltransferase